MIEGLRIKYQDTFHVGLKNSILKFICKQNANVNNNKIKELKIDIQHQFQAKFPDNMTGICMDLADCNQLNSEGFSSIKELLNSTFKEISLLELNLNRCERLKHEDLSGLLTSMGKLQSLYLGFAEWKTMEASSLMTEVKSLKNSLIDLKLNFSGCEKINNDDFNEFLDGMQELQSVNLIFEGCKAVTDVAYERLILSLTNLEKLKSLSLNFANCPKVSSFQVNMITSSRWARAENLKKLQSLSLSFSKCPFSNTDSTRFLQIMSSSLQNPQCVEIILPNLTSQDIKSFKTSNKGLERVPQLHIHSDQP